MEVYTVTEALYYLKIKIDCDDRLTDLWMEGEVSNCKRNPSGHYFFDLKDGTGRMACALFRGNAARLRHLPKDGSNFVMHGRMDVYEQQGKLQFYVDMVQPAGLGRLHLEYEALKQRLESEGLFAPERKRPLPARPRTIGIVTSPAAAAFQDILNVLGRRYPLAQLILAPTQVQGDTAPPGIVAALRALNERDDIDVIILARGGGSIEDLWCFNDERVARAVFASRVPIITGVGHEIDFTIVDYVADLRAPTPSAAAELVAPDLEELRDEVNTQSNRLYIALQNQLDQQRSDLSVVEQRLQVVSPQARFANYRQRLLDFNQDAKLYLRHSIELHQTRVSALASRLQVLNPQQILERGYAIVTRQADGSVISETSQINNGEPLQIRVKDGTFEATTSSKS